MTKVPSKAEYLGTGVSRVNSSDAPCQIVRDCCHGCKVALEMRVLGAGAWTAGSRVEDKLSSPRDQVRLQADVCEVFESSSYGEPSRRAKVLPGSQTGATRDFHSLQHLGAKQFFHLTSTSHNVPSGRDISYTG
jgi:hypothetical protein